MGSIFEMKQKKVVIFGGAGYLGSAITRAFLNEGAKVVVADVFPEWSEPYIQDLRENPNCVCFQCNLESTDEIKAACDPGSDPLSEKERKQRDCKYLFHVWPGITRLQDLRGQRTE